jgi:pyrroline-5-carboxylate reductase
MAEAILAGIIKSGKIPASDIMTVDTSPARQTELTATYGTVALPSAISAFEEADIVVMAVKPQHMSHVFNEVQNRIVNKDVLVVSIVAGYTMDQLQRGLGVPMVVRAMPNTPALIREAVTSWTISPDVSKSQALMVRELLLTFGKAIYLPEEEKMDMATALAGSGPALCQLMLEAMIDTGVHMGLPREQAYEMVTETMKGAVNLTIASKDHPSMLRNDITSPGGTTAAALYEIERGGLRTVMSDSIWAAYRRSRELGGLDSCVGPGRFHYNAQLELPEELVENLKGVTESMNDIKEELADVTSNLEAEANSNGDVPMQSAKA